jgi:transposase-like protein
MGSWSSMDCDPTGEIPHNSTFFEVQIWLRSEMKGLGMNSEDEIVCPDCGSRRCWKDGIRYTRYGEVQRYMCRDCGYRFS